MAYNSAYTGPQVDAAVGAVRNKETTWDAKQNALSGTEDQIVGFNSTGNAAPVPKPIGLPDGGTPGQMLYQGESGAEWGDKPVFHVTLTPNVEDMTYQADKTFEEIKQAAENGYVVQANMSAGEQSISFPFSGITELGASFGGVMPALLKSQGTFSLTGQQVFTIVISPDGSVSNRFFGIHIEPFENDRGEPYVPITYNGASIVDCYSINAFVPRYVSVTLPASAWSNNTQTVTVTGVLADETAQLIQPMPAMASQSAYYGAGVLCSEQAANSLTFTCQNVPTEDLTVYVVMQEVEA